MLTTSRNVLGIDGEQILEVRPLPVPDVTDLDSAQKLDAVALFTDRARAIAPEFAVEEENWAEVVHVCRRLDGIPLAIELAVRGLRVLPLSDVAARLDDGFRMLPTASRTAPPRQRTLEAAIDWSRALCSESERMLWSRLSIFDGGFDLAAAEAVCAADDPPNLDVLELLAGLIDKSIVYFDKADGAVRYSMLEMVRDYGQRMALAAGEEAELRTRHLRHCLVIARQAEEGWRSGGKQPEVVKMLRADLANFRAALEFGLGSHDHRLDGLRLAATLFPFWLHCGHVVEGRRFLDLALEVNPEPSRSRTQALWVDAFAISLQGDVVAGDIMAAECVAAATEQGDEEATA